MSSTPSSARLTSAPGLQDGVEDTDFGTHEFAALDLDGNLIGFFTWVEQ